MRLGPEHLPQTSFLFIFFFLRFFFLLISPLIKMPQSQKIGLLYEYLKMTLLHEMNSVIPLFLLFNFGLRMVFPPIALHIKITIFRTASALIWIPGVEFWPINQRDSQIKI